jgi:predicted amino acid racemase
MSSDHLVVDLGDLAAAVGDELAFGVGYGGLLRAMTSPYVAIVERQPTRV